MAKYYYARKKSKKKTPKQSSVRWLASALYILGFAIDAWLFAMLWFGRTKGTASEVMHAWFYQLFGQGAPLIPLFLTYWLVRSLVMKTTAFFFFLLGCLITLSSFAAVLTTLKLIFTQSQISGGAVGEKLFYWFENFAGPVGAALFSVALLLVGLQSCGLLVF